MRRTIRRLTYAFLMGAAVYLLWRHTPLFTPLKNLLKPAPVAVDESPLLVTQVKSMAQLMTVEAYNEVVVDSTRYPFGLSAGVAKRLPVSPLKFLGAAQLVLIVKGKVIVGTDLQTLDTADIRVRGDSLFIRLPRAAVLDVITNPSDVEVFSEQGTWSEAATTALKMQARAEMVQQAMAQGALQQADARARQLVYELFKNTRYKNVVVTTAIGMATPSGKQ